jgi:hypothetical protein
LAPAESLPFQVIEAFPSGATPATCTATVAGTETFVTLTGSDGSGTGLLLLSLNFGRDPRGVGYNPPTPDWYEFSVTVERTKTADVVYDASAMREIGGAGKLEICFAALRPFSTKGAPLQPFDYDGDPRTGPDGKEGFVGLLPAAGTTPRNRASSSGDRSTTMTTTPTGTRATATERSCGSWSRWTGAIRACTRRSADARAPGLPA